MSTEYGIFSDESADHTSDEAVESQMYSREEAEKRLAELRAEGYANGAMEPGEDDNLYVHECEEPEEPDDEEDEDYDDEEDEDDEVECHECGSLNTEYSHTCANCRIARCKDCGEETSY